MRVGRLVCALALTLGTTAATVLPVGSASAAVDDVPHVRVNIRSIELAAYSGAVSVLARVRCTPEVDGVGTASWSVKATQDVRARATAAIPCDGKRRTVGLRLVPKNGRFEHGALDVQLSTLAEGTNSAEGTATFFTTTI